MSQEWVAWLFDHPVLLSTATVMKLFEYKSVVLLRNSSVDKSVTTLWSDCDDKRIAFTIWGSGKVWDVPYQFVTSCQYYATSSLCYYVSEYEAQRESNQWRTEKMVEHRWPTQPDTGLVGRTEKIRWLEGIHKPKVTVVWDVAPCSLVEKDRRFRGAGDLTPVVPSITS
jgi:hypothetical protein